MGFQKIFRVGLLLVAAQISALAADLAILKNGSSIPFVRKEAIGSVTRLHMTGGYLDIPTTDIASYDKDESVLPEPTPAAPPLATNPAPAKPTVQFLPPQVAAAPAPGPAAAKPAQQVDLDQVVREASRRYQLDPDFVASVIKAESNFKAHAVSRKGARGLMQLMPQTASQLGVVDAFDPKANVEAGTAHLSALLDMYHDDPIKALAAYNAGAHRVAQYHGVPPYRETRAYVAQIVRDFNAKKRAQMKAASASATANSTKSGQNIKGGKKKIITSHPQQASVPKPAKPA